MAWLYLMRHGIAVPHGTPGVAEDERPLTPKGEKRVRQIGRGLRDAGIVPERIITSPLPRAARTAELVAEVLGIEAPVDRHDILRPEQEAASIREWLRNQTDADIMLVGHNPSLSDLVRLLLGDVNSATIAELRKGGIAAFRGSKKAAMKLEWLATPRLLRHQKEKDEDDA